MLAASVLLTAAIAQAVLATPIARSTYAVKETHYVPRRWTQKGRAPKDQMLALQIGVKQGDFEELERHLYEGNSSAQHSEGGELTLPPVSDPHHTRYGQHLSHSEVNALVAPKDEALDYVHEWLLSNGIKEFDYSPAKDWVNIKISVEKAEELLDTEYSVFVHDDGTEQARTTRWSLPKHLHEHVDTIQPTTSFMRVRENAQFEKTYVPHDYKPPTNETLKRVCTINGTTPDCCELVS
jgi:tripeptidyl-peptidase-1